ncbi:MAG TPA: hypothetical protein VGB85_04280, partial [Nannocystis sp.]
LAQAGVEGGLATAAAIAAGSDQAIKDFNKLQGEISSVGVNLGNATADSMYAAGIKVSEGVVRGLERQGAVIDKAAQKLARRISTAIEVEMGGKSRVKDRPKLKDSATSSRTAAGAGGTVTVRLTAEQMSRVQRGKEIILDVNAARRAGVRFDS